MLQKKLGAFYTPEKLAKTLAEKVLTPQKERVLEPSFGDGVFLKVLRENSTHKHLDVTAVEINDKAIFSYIKNTKNITEQIIYSDFLDVQESKYDLIIGNPPYVRLGELGNTTFCKAQMCTDNLDFNVSKNHSLWVYFIFKSLKMLKENGTMAFVLPITITTSNYNKKVISFLCENFGTVKLERIAGNIFNDALVQTTVLICDKFGKNTNHIEMFLYNSLEAYATEKHTFISLSLEKFLSETNPFSLIFSSFDINKLSELCLPVSHFCKFKQGYIAGHKFFHLIQKDIERYELSENVIPCIDSGKTLASSQELTFKENDIVKYLFYPQKFDKSVETYIKTGEQLGINKCYKCSKRPNWYKIAINNSPDIIFPALFDYPKMLINENKYPASSSILCGIMQNDFSPIEFICRWYNSLTLYNVEKNFKTVGGGGLNPSGKALNEINIIAFIPSEKCKEIYKKFNECYMEKGIEEVYRLGDELVLKEILHISEKTIEELRDNVNELKNARNR